MFALARTQLDASCVDLCLSARLMRSDENNLMTAGANVLRAFRIRPQADQEQGAFDESNPPKMGLECVGTWRLHAPIQSVCKVRLGGLTEGRDALLLAFMDAKLSVVAFDPDCHDLKTLSLHIFEEQEMRDGFAHNLSAPEVRVDPDNRCAAMLVYGRKIVVLPIQSISESNSTATSTEGEAMSTSYTLDLNQVALSAGGETRINNIVDFQFLHGYNQPTMLILYEPLKTFSGRIAVRKDTCRVDVITLDVKERLSAFIWSKDNLPFDCTQAMAVPKPIGGLLVLAPNSIFYLSQGMPPVGVSINSLGDATLDNVEKKVENTGLALDGGHGCFLDGERVVFSLKGGELYVMSLLLDALRNVRGFHFDRAAASVLSTSICKVEEGFLFLGSRLGNPILLRYTEKEVDSSSIQDQPSAKRQRLAPMLNNFLIDENSLDVDLQVYGEQAHSLGLNGVANLTGSSLSNQLKSLKFEVCESLLNVGPCSNVSMGEPAFLSEEFATHRQADPDVELVTSSGYGKNGAICLLQRSIKPQVVTTFELPSCRDMFTVHSTEGLKEEDDEGYHSFLLLARDDSTIVLETGDEINEVEKSGFYTEGTTVLASNLGGFIVQVSSDRIRLIGSKAELIQELMLSENITQASVADPYLLVLTDDHQVSQVTVEGRKLIILKVNLRRGRGQVVAINAYKDKSGLFTEKEGDAEDFSTDLQVDSSKATLEEDEDELLYGSASIIDNTTSTLTEGSSKKKQWWHKDLLSKQETFWAVLFKKSGQLEFWTMPDFSLKYVISDLAQGKEVLSDAGDSPSSTTDSQTPTSSSISSLSSLKRSSLPSPITEVLVVGLGLNGRRPLLMARNEMQDLFVYEAFEYKDKNSKTEGRLRLRFKRHKTQLILRRRSSRKVGKVDDLESNDKYFRCSLRFFEDVSGYEGVFICGPYPHWLMMSGRGELRSHPMSIDDCISSFATFHNKNCQKGFIYFNHKSQLRISVLPTHVSYDAGWPVRRMPLKSTVHFVAYHLDSKTYAVVTAHTETTRQVWKFNGDDKELFTEEREDPDRFPWPTHDNFSLTLYSPLYWKAIPNTQQEFEPYERCTSMKHLFLSCEGLHSGQRGYIVCSTSFSYGEDVTPKGNIRIYDVVEVVPEIDQPITKNQVKLIYCKEQKGPVTALSSVNGYLVAAVGQKVYIFQFKNKDLFGVAFIDSQIYIHQLVSLKSFLLVGDVLKSVDLMQFQQDYRTLAVISRDTNRNIEVYSCEFLVDNTQVACIVSDADRNLILFVYQPENPEALGGQKLVRCADFQLGQQITTMFRIKARITDPSLPGRVLTGYEKRHITWFGTLDGALGYLLPCSEKMYRRLLMLQNMLTQSVEHVAGLNPKASRMLRQRYRELINPSRSVLDADLIFSFVDLPWPAQRDISRRIGIDVHDLIDNLAELDRMAAHF